MLTIETFDAYTKRLGNHDWTYSYSDDHRAWRSGSAVEAELLGVAKLDTSGILNQAYEAHQAYAFAGLKMPSGLTREQNETFWATQRTTCETRIAELRSQVELANQAAAAL